MNKDCKDRKSANHAIPERINSASDCGIIQFEKCTKTMINSFSSPITNGFTEGCSNKPKVLKRNAYGCLNFKCFSVRILHIFSHQTKKQATAF